MLKTREEMMNDLITKIGLENPIVDEFCARCEDHEETEHNNKLLNEFYEAILNLMRIANQLN